MNMMTRINARFFAFFVVCLFSGIANAQRSVTWWDDSRDDSNDGLYYIHNYENPDVFLNLSSPGYVTGIENASMIRWYKNYLTNTSMSVYLTGSTKDANGYLQYNVVGAEKKNTFASVIDKNNVVTFYKNTKVNKVTVSYFLVYDVDEDVVKMVHEDDLDEDIHYTGWTLISESQYNAVYYTSTLNDFDNFENATFTRYDKDYDVYCSSKNGNSVWYVGETVTGAASTPEDGYARMTIGNVPNGYYQLQLYAGKTGSGAARIYANDGSAEVTTNPDQTLYTVFAHVTDGTLDIYMGTDDKTAGAVYSAINSIVKVDGGDDDEEEETSAYLTNPKFTDGLTGWTVESDNENLVFELETGSSTNGFQKQGLFAKMGGSVFEQCNGQVYQTVTLPAGYYSLSADVFAWRTMAFLYAQVGDRRQKVAIFDTGDKSYEPTRVNRTLKFIVPEETEVRVGISQEQLTDTTFFGDWCVSCDNFVLEQLNTDIEGADLSSQIVNADLLSAEIDNKNVLYTRFGWNSNGSDGFQAWMSDVAQVYYDAGLENPWNSYDTYQTVTGLPDGYYKVRVQGFYRDAMVAAGSDSEQKTSFYANNSMKGIQLITSEPQQSEEFYGYEDEEKTRPQSIGGYPNNMNAAKIAFDAGMYDDNVVIGRVKDGTLKLGIVRNLAKEWDWTCLNSFRLYYYKAELDETADVTEWVANYSFESGDETAWSDGNEENNVTRVNTPFSDAGTFYYETKGAVTLTHDDVTGLPEGLYTLTCQINGNKGTVTLNGNDKYVESAEQSGTVTLNNIELYDGKTLVISVSTTNAAKIDNFTLRRTSKSRVVDGGEYYVYNVDAGAFLTNGNDWNTQACVGADGLKWTLSKIDGQQSIITLSQSAAKNHQGYDAPGYLYVSQNKLYVDGQDNSFSMKVTEDENSSNITLAVNPDDATYGSATSYGETLIGWGGDVNTNIIMPHIGTDDKELRGTRWMLMSEQEYIKYHDRIIALRSERMTAWNYMRSALLSGVSVKQIDNAYVNPATTTLETLTTVLREDIEDQDLLADAYSESSVDLSYYITNADCGTISGWTNENTNERSDKVFQEQSNYQKTGEVQFGAKFLEKWIYWDYSLENGTLSQTLTSLPAGVYVLSLDAKAERQNTTEAVTGVSLFATVNNSGDVRTVSEALSTPDDNIKTYTTSPFYVAEGGTVTLGVDIENTNANWVAFDNFHLSYVGLDERYYEKEDGLITFYGVWRDVDYTEMCKAIANVCPSVSVDFRKATLQETVNIELDDASNVLAYKQHAQTVTINSSSTNVVDNLAGTLICDNFVITDKKAINIAYKFGAKKATYSRTGLTLRSDGTAFGTICLPFDISSASGNCENLDNFYAITKVTDGWLTIATQSSSSVLVHNTPAIFVATATDFSIEQNGTLQVPVTVFATERLMQYEASNNVSLYGTYSKYMVGQIQTYNTLEDLDNSLTNEDGLSAGSCYYISKNVFYNGRGWFYNTPFRAFIHDGNYDGSLGEASKRPASLNIFVEDTSTAIENVVLDEEEVFVVDYVDESGISHAESVKGLNIVRYSNGMTKKIFVK